MNHKSKLQRESLFLAGLSWIHVLLIFSGTYLIPAGIWKLSPKNAAGYFLLSAWLILPTVLSWIFIRKIRALWAYLLCSSASAWVIWMLSNSLQTTLLSMLIFLLRCYVRVIKGRIKKQMQEMPGELGAQLDKELWEIPTFLDQPRPLHWVFFIIYYICILFTRRYFLLRWVFFLLLAEIFVCFLSGYLEQMRQFIRENQRIANLPANMIRKTGKIILSLSVILLVLAVLPSVIYNREPLIALMERPKAEKPLSMDEFELLPEEEQGMGGFDFSALAGEYREAPAWLKALSDILFFLVAAIAAVFFILMIYRACRNTAHYFSQNEEDEILFIGTDTEEPLFRRLVRPKENREKRNSPNRKIRRFYKKILRRALPEQPCGWETPSQLEEKADLLQKPDSALLHELYEKARYSQGGCSEDEAAAVSSMQK